MNGHHEFKKNLNKIMKKINRKGLIVDGRYYFSKEQIKRIKKSYSFLGSWLVKKILITGGAGFIGTNIIKKLIKKKLIFML